MPFLAAHPSLLRSLSERGYHEPTPVQQAVLGVDAYERDLLVSAQTGSGKTVAFGLAMAPNLLGDAETFGPAHAPLALVVTPTRELAMQVQRELEWLYAKTNVKLATCVGGMDIRREQYNLRHGVHIVVGTPGRLNDHLERGVLVLNQLRVVVLDEADEMLDMGFRDDIERMLTAAPANRRTLLFSATIPKEIAELTKRYQRNAHRLATTSENERHGDIEYRAVTVLPREKELAVVNVLRYFEANGALVFCATRDGVTRLSTSLQERGFSCVALSGDLSQRERTQALQALRDRRAKVCVATDVAARGLDLPDLGLVIHGDLPQNREILLHRSGRTGRAGKKGTAVLIVPDTARRYAERMLMGAKIDIKWTLPPTLEQIQELDDSRILASIAPILGDITDEDRKLGEQLLATSDAAAIAGALVRMQRGQLPVAEELTVPRAGQARRNDRPERNERRNEGRYQDERSERRPNYAQVERTPAAAKPPTGAAPTADKRKAKASDAPDVADRADKRAAKRADTRKPEAAPPSGGGWFALNVGSLKRADPKWLIPLICRRGDVDKSAIGKIRVMPRETHFEISPAARAGFEAAIARPIAAGDKDKSVRIAALD